VSQAFEAVVGLDVVAVRTVTVGTCLLVGALLNDQSFCSHAGP
jgi:hypothetical protein